MRYNASSMDPFFEQRSPAPDVDIVTTAEQTRIDIAAPGMKKDEFSVEVEGDTLTVSAQVEKSTKGQSYKRSFSRSWSLGSKYAREQVSAEYVDGVLSVTVPHVPSAAPKKQTISVK
mgnify:CR=1 FL=1